MAGADASGDQPHTAADEPGSAPDRAPQGPRATRRRQMGMAALALGALGVVFGDIGTSPLYALQTVFSADNHAVKPTEGDVYGVISLVFWSITVIVSIEFVTFIMRADNDGDGGIMALIALVQGVSLRGRRAKAALIVVGMFGVALFYGDGMITPAISVLSAVEGLEVASPSLESLVVPITIALLTVLFAIQRFGTGAIGRFFGPVMAIWFGVIAIAGLGRVLEDPAILKALSPSYGVEFFTAHPGIAFISLAAIVLTITGAEALYADMGHFGRPPIRRAWFLAVFPALTLNYMGQGSLILDTPSAIDNPFFLLIPHWARMPMVVLATVATVIASQAVISGAFSVTRQAVRLGFLPRLSIRHTSEEEIGQVYAPAVNWALLIAVIGLVIGFGSSAHLASAYGIAVTGTITVDTLLFLVVVHKLWRKPTWVSLAGALVFLTVDLAFLAANVPKVVLGGWFPLSVGLLMFVVLNTWKRGSDALVAARIREEGPLQEFVEELRAMDPPLDRVAGTAVYLNARRETTPLALRETVERFGALHETVIILSIETTKAPHVLDADRLVIDDLGYEDDGISHVTARFGYHDPPEVPRTVALAREAGLETEVDVERATFFLSHVEVGAKPAPILHRWRRRLFTALWRNAASPVEYFRLPADRTVTLGSLIEI
jgi:KUP system potassium uptake protein